MVGYASCKPADVLVFKVYANFCYGAFSLYYNGSYLAVNSHSTRTLLIFIVDCANEKQSTFTANFLCRFWFLLLPRRICNRHCVCLSVCLLTTLCKNFQMDLHEIFREGWQWANEQMIKFRWQSGSPSGYVDCFPDSSLSGDTESA